MEIVKLKSEKDNLELEVCVSTPKGKPKGIVQISHGMTEHKERYYPFMKYLNSKGYVCVIHDHRGHGASVKTMEDHGYFYTNDTSYIRDDLHLVTKYIKDRYKELDITLFSHSMGTLVARNYLKVYDNEIDKLILCGPPTRNGLVDVAIILAKIACLFSSKKHNRILNKLSVGSYNKNFKEPRGWLCSDTKVVEEYDEDPLSGFIFTSNGFLNLFKMLKEVYIKKDYEVNNKNMPILVIAGEDDPVIGDTSKFNHLVNFLKELGYKKVSSKLYKGMRHELLNEVGNEKVYEDIVKFISK